MIPPWLVSDFLSWLWFLSEDGGTVPYKEQVLDVIVDGALGLKVDDDATTKATYRGNIGKDARKSFAMGKSVSEVAVIFRLSDREYDVRFTVKGGLSVVKVHLPVDSLSGDDREAGVHDNLLVLDELEGIVDHLFGAYLTRRVTDSEKLLSQIRTLEVEAGSTESATGEEAGDDES